MKPLAPYRNAAFSLDALCEAALRLLSAKSAPTDARVQALPDARAVRYYQTLGLLDRPVRYDGRQAVYGLRHLLQLVVIKRLQAHDLSLAQIQNALSGRTDAELEAALGADEVPVGPAPSAKAPREPRTWFAGEVADGVVVTIDPSVVPDPDALLQRIRSLLSPGGRS